MHFSHLKVFVIVVQTDKRPGCVLPFHQLMTGIINPFTGANLCAFNLAVQKSSGLFTKSCKRGDKNVFAQTRSQKKKRRSSCEFHHFHFHPHSRLIFQLFGLFPPSRDQAVINNRTRQKTKKPKSLSICPVRAIMSIDKIPPWEFCHLGHFFKPAVVRCLCPKVI